MRVRSRSLLAKNLLGLGLSIWAAPAHGQVPEKRETVSSASSAPAQFVFGSLDCPDPKTVQQAVLTLIPTERHPLLARGVRIELEDLGESYRVTVWRDGSSVKKLYSDPARECDGRARFAAVFTVLTLMPPELGAELDVAATPEPAAEPPAAPKPAAAVAPTPPQAAVQPPLTRLELSALYAYAPAILAAPSIHSFGGELRLAFGRGPVAATLSIAYAAPAELELDGVQAELSRIPLSAGVRLRRDFQAWAVSADLGLLLVAEHVRATNLLTAETRDSASFGLRVGFQVARRLGPHFAPFLGAFLWITPNPSELSALPQGVLGNLPYLWLGGAAGVQFGL